MAAHRSAEPGHDMLLHHLGLRPLLDLEMRLGEASGAVAVIPLIRMAAAVVVDVPTFEEFGLPAGE
ncbi:Nicotinate-nucleotide--dimethylbenzimidazole phosphoribosyltransferase [hydrothermal vent metagenome]|uniref:Nicotinate-nucleotide--dimethylbenzimidazole phosphoribosyltransferase n=1 Tax=hydrothermal vent metagenome TaxID=652676 RepID=A0A3B0SRA3_9ZZZZ